MSRILVVGGGISGLSAAHELLTQGADVRLIEAEDRVGGCIGSTVRGGYRFENGPTGIQGACPGFRGLCDELGISGQIIDASGVARDRFLFHRGRLTPLPRSLREFARTKLFTRRQKARVLLEPFVRTGALHREETVAEFFGRRLGRGITMTWIDILVSGIYAGNPNRLGVRSAFPALGRMETERGSILRAMRDRARARRQADGTVASSPLITLKAGLDTLTNAIRDRLGPRVLSGLRARTLVRENGSGVSVQVESHDGSTATLAADRVVLAVPAPVAGILLGPLASEVADLLFEIEYSSLIVGHAAFDQTAVPGLVPGFGFLVPRNTRVRTLGWIFSSHVFPHLAPEGKVTMNAFLGGTLDAKAIEMDDAAAEWLLVGELALCLNQRRNPIPEVFGIVRWPDAIPQYNVGHDLRMAAVRKLLEVQVPEAAIAGNWITGGGPAAGAHGRDTALALESPVSIESCIRRGREAAREVLQSLRRVGAGG